MAEPLFVAPPESLFASYDDGGEYLDGYGTYTAYNYAGGSPAAWVKRRHFEVALRLVRDRFGANAIDFGCADGVFLPSLSRWFGEVCAIDRNPAFVRHAQHVVDTLELPNVTVVDNRELGWDELRERVPRDARVAFLLETLEHIGDVEDLYPSKVRFLEDLLTLLAGDGVIVISVPTMVGPGFLVQRAALAALRMHREPLTKRQLFDAVVRRRTDELEPNWEPTSHLGFNHVKLERHLRGRLRVLSRRSLGVAMVYVVGR